MTSDLRIVGIDPGTTAAVAVLDLEGGLVDYASRKEFGKDELIRFIVDAGKPLLVGADVAPAPSRVDEIASNMGAVLVAPDDDLQAGYKDDLVAGFPVDGDMHTRDALAAAEYARRTHADQLAEIRRQVDAAGVPEQFDDVVELVVGAGLSVTNALSEVSKAEPEAPDAEETDPVEPDWETVAARRKRRIDVLEEKVANLEGYIDELETEEEPVDVPDTELRRRNRIIRDLEGDVAELEARLDRSTERIDRLQAAIDRLRKGWVYAPRVEHLAEAAGEVVAVDGYDGEPVAAPVRTVIAPTDLPELRQEGIGVVVDPDDAVHLEDALIVPPTHTDTGNAAEDQEEFMEWLETYRER